MKSGSLGAIVRSFKSAVTREVRSRRPNVWHVWQRNYYERIIRDEAELLRVRRYIHDNPTKWQHDIENPDRVVSTMHDDAWSWLEDHRLRTKSETDA